MTTDSEQACNNPKQSIYFLGESKGSLPDAARSLIEACRGWGEFLSPDYMPEGLGCYEQDSQSLHSMPPLLVFRPYLVSCIPPFIQACRDLEIPVTVRAGGSGLTGGATACRGGVILLTGHFQSISEYDRERGTIVVEPGVTPRQIEERVSGDGWRLPLEIASAGIAGLAGCLCTQAKGYHQAHYSPTQNLVSVTFIDGHGEEVQAPASLLSGSEGMLGVVTQLRLQLNRRPQAKRVVQYSVNRDSVFDVLLALSAISSLTSLVGHPDLNELTAVLEGDSWRVEESMRYIERFFGPGRSLSSEWVLNIPFPSRKSFFLFSQTVPRAALPHVLSCLPSVCSDHTLSGRTWVNFLDESVHILVESDCEARNFFRAVEAWLVSWVHVLESAGGILIGRHGVGPFLRHYLPPFYGWEDLQFLQNFCLDYDPKRLFSSGHFFPSPGKSLEKVVLHER
jgi:glycolate oxidase